MGVNPLRIPHKFTGGHQRPTPAHAVSSQDNSRAFSDHLSYKRIDCSRALDDSQLTAFVWGLPVKTEYTKKRARKT